MRDRWAIGLFFGAAACFGLTVGWSRSSTRPPLIDTEPWNAFVGFAGVGLLVAACILLFWARREA